MMLLLLLLVVCLLPHLPQLRLQEIIMINQYHPLQLPLPPRNQHRYLHHLVLQGEMIIKVVITTATVVEKDGEEGDMIEIGIIVVKIIIDDMIMIVTIEEDEVVVLTDMTIDTTIDTMTDTMIEIGIGIEDEIITVVIIA